MNFLFFIPARGGSKGIPRKNIKLLNNKPLILYSIEVARAFADDCNICVSSDDDEIINIVEMCGLKVPFKRPKELATDHASGNDVIIHALNYYENIGVIFDAIVELQPTSPLRQIQDVKNAIDIFDKTIDMVVSVKETSANPYYVLFEENSKGYLEKSKNGDFVRRQDCPIVYELNGAVYVINTESLKRSKIKDFKKVKKSVMSDLNSVDLDKPSDWEYAEYLISKFQSQSIFNR
jgi:CMP-N,N'-diacetyllegionaminic acid synthase